MFQNINGRTKNACRLCEQSYKNTQVFDKKEKNDKLKPAFINIERSILFQQQNVLTLNHYKFFLNNYPSQVTLK